jgi:F0F1-type ATP synthase membrane subunit b/b'
MMFRQMGGVNLDIDATFFIQLAFIILTMIVLRKLVFKPYLRVAAIRDDLTTKTIERAEETSLRAQSLADEFEKKLFEAKQEALALKTSLRAEGIATKTEFVDAANADAQALLTTSRESLSSEVADVRQASQGLVDELAGLIVKKVLNRGVEPFAGASEGATSTEDEVQV